MNVVEHQPEGVIESWMISIAANDGVERFDDLHIDRINPAWKQRDVWIEKATEAFHIAVSVRDRNKMPFLVALGFSLHSSDSPTGINFQTEEEFLGQLDWSPPSLYLFRYGDEPHTQTESAKVQALNPVILGVMGDARCYYLEFKQKSADEYHRSVFLEG